MLQILKDEIACQFIKEYTYIWLFSVKCFNKGCRTMEGHMMNFSEPIITNEESVNSKIMPNITNKTHKLENLIKCDVHTCNSGNVPF